MMIHRDSRVWATQKTWVQNVFNYYLLNISYYSLLCYDEVTKRIFPSMSFTTFLSLRTFICTSIEERQRRRPTNLYRRHPVQLLVVVRVSAEEEVTTTHRKTYLTFSAYKYKLWFASFTFPTETVPQPLVHSFIRSQTYLTGRRITTRQASIATRTTFSHLHRHSYCTRKLLCHLLFRIPPHFTCINIINTPLYICRSSLGSTPESSALEFGEDSTVQYRRRNAAHSPCNIDLYAVSVMANTWGGTSWRFMPLYRSMIFSV